MKQLQQLLTAVFILLSIQATAQIEVGIKAGLNSSQFNLPIMNDIGILDLDRGIGSQYGVFAIAPIAGPLSARIEGNIINRNYKLGVDFNLLSRAIGQDIDIPLNLNVKFKTQYYEIPVLFQAQIAEGKISPYVLGGAAISGHLASKVAVGLFGTDIGVPINNLGLTKTEWSGIAGLGATFDLDGVNLFVEGRYQHGFTKLVDLPLVQGFDITPKNNNNSIVFNIGMAIPIGSKSNRSIALR